MLACASVQSAEHEYADVAQLVEHHLAKVRVAGSNPVVRSAELSFEFSQHGGVAERRGNGLQSRLHGFKSRLHLDAGMFRPAGQKMAIWAVGAAVARFPDTEEVTGSIPVPPTGMTASLAADLRGPNRTRTSRNRQVCPRVRQTPAT